jgi:tripartite-type tricarboxylate transporter receptor subunit TctC
LLPAKSAKGLIALSKTKPGELYYGPRGVGASSHMSGEIFVKMTGIKSMHVPYKGEARGQFDLVGGTIAKIPGLTVWNPHNHAARLDLNWHVSR